MNIDDLKVKAVEEMQYTARNLIDYISSLLRNLHSDMSHNDLKVTGAILSYLDDLLSDSERLAKELKKHMDYQRAQALSVSPSTNAKLH